MTAVFADGLLSGGSQAVVQDLLSIAALVGVLGGLMRWAWRKVVVPKLDGLAVTPEQVEAAVEAVMARRVTPLEARQLAIEQMVRELVPNGGGSLADAIHRIEAEITELRNRPPVVVNHYNPAESYPTAHPHFRPSTSEEDRT